MRPAALALLTLAVAAPAAALTPADVERAVPFASKGLGPVVRFLASDRLRGRDNDTPESLKARKKLARALRRIGDPIHPGVRGLEGFSQHFTAGAQKGTNLLAVMRGGDLAHEYVMVGGHYDGLDSRSNAAGACASTRTPGNSVCNGATDNAAGVAAVLAIGRALRRLPAPPRRSVVFALWDAEEDGLLGSLHYVNHPIVPLAQTRVYVNFDLVGSNLLPSLGRTSFAVGGETGGAALTDVVAAAVDAEPLDTLPVSYIFGQLRSDYASFAGAGVSTVYFSDSTNGCYHTVHDDVDVVDFAKLEAQSRIGFRTVVGLTETAAPPAFVPPHPGLAVYADAVSLRRVFTTAQSDLPLFPPADQQVIAATGAAIEQIVADGPDAFDQSDVATLLTAALDGVAAIQRLGCRR